MAAGRGPGQHDALPGPAQRPRSWSTSGPCASSRSRRSPRRSRPPAAWPCRPSSATCSGPRAATCTPSSSACCPSGRRPISDPALQPAPARAALLVLLVLADRRARVGQLGGADRPGQHLPVHQRHRLRRPGGAVADGPGGAVGQRGALRPSSTPAAGRSTTSRRARVRQHRLRHRQPCPGGGGDGGAAPVLRPGRVDRGQLRAARGQALHPHRPHRLRRPGSPAPTPSRAAASPSGSSPPTPPNAWPARPPPPSASSPATSWPATSTGAPPAACNWTRPRRRPWVRTRTPSTPSRWSSARSSRGFRGLTAERVGHPDQAPAARRDQAPLDAVRAGRALRHLDRADGAC